MHSSQPKARRCGARAAVRALVGVLAGAALAAGAAACGGGKARAGGQTPEPSPGARGAGPDAYEPQGQNGARLEEMFTGRFPGVQVYPQNGGVLIRVRGQNTIYGNTEPLFVLDGQVLEQGNGGIVDVNPNDIARIEVVKSAADLAMYGSRGANGVVVITTKRGRGRAPGGA